LVAQPTISVAGDDRNLSFGESHLQQPLTHANMDSILSAVVAFRVPIKVFSGGGSGTTYAWCLIHLTTFIIE